MARRSNSLISSAKTAAAVATPASVEPRAVRPMTTSTIHLPVETLSLLRQAADRRSVQRAIEHGGRGGRPSVSEIVVELLDKYEAEIREMR